MLRCAVGVNAMAKISGRSKLAGALLALSALAAEDAARADELLVAAAASLANAFREVGRSFEAAHPGTSVAFDFAASDLLVAQIARGAPVDVLAAADEDAMNRAERTRLLAPGTRRDFASNRLVLIVPARGRRLAALDELRGAGVRRIAIGSPKTVPAGRYAMAALESAQLAEPLAGKLVFAANVRQALDYVARGEAEAGFVYATDAALMPDRVTAALDVATPKPIRYPVAAIAASRAPARAREFVEFLSGEAARQTLVRNGFAMPVPP
jgi:molybdate transport system substrate-binding protein